MDKAATQTQASKGQRSLLTPSLFVAPPQQNISNTSLQLIPTQTSQTSTGIPSRMPLQKQRSNLGERPRTAETSPLESLVGSSAGSTTSSANSPTSRVARTNSKDAHRQKLSHLSTSLSPIQDTVTTPWQQQYNSREPRSGNGREQDHTEAIWAEMQSTLEEVELGAANGLSIFHRDHSRALEELRKAQIALAQAWARSESLAHEASDGAGMNLDGMKQSELEVTNALADDRMEKLGIGSHAGDGTLDKNQRNQKSSRPGTANSAAQRSHLDEETENDILLARKRRQANDRYFEKVNKGVMDVVAKLELVAKEMGAVEKESQEIWGDLDSLESGSDG